MGEEQEEGAVDPGMPQGSPPAPLQNEDDVLRRRVDAFASAYLASPFDRIEGAGMVGKVLTG